MSRLSETLNKLRNSVQKTHSEYIPSARKFTEIDVMQIADKLNLQERGEKRGEEDRPLTEYNEMDDIEYEIIQNVEKIQKNDTELFIDQLTTYSDRIHRLSINSITSAIRSYAREAVTDFEAEVHLGKDELFNIGDDVKNHLKDYNRFKSFNQIEREPSYPDSKIFHIGIICLLLLIEGLLNGSLIGQGHEAGLIGGWITAITISTLNIIFGFSVGRIGIPCFSMNKTIKKTIGLLICVIYVPMIAFFNIAVAHYRDALQGSNPELAGKIAIDNLLSMPFDIDSIESLFLIILGILFSFIALYDGLKWDDIYPGYGNMKRKYIESCNRYVEKKTELMNILKEMRDDVSTVMRDTQTDLTKRLDEHKSILEGKNRLKINFEQYLNHLNGSINQLLSIYREANKSKRKSPVPTHFNQKYTLPTLNIDSNILDNDINEFKRNEEIINTTNNDLEMNVNQVQEAYLKAIYEYPSLNDIIKNEN